MPCCRENAYLRVSSFKFSGEGPHTPAVGAPLPRMSGAFLPLVPLSHGLDTRPCKILDPPLQNGIFFYQKWCQLLGASPPAPPPGLCPWPGAPDPPSYPRTSNDLPSPVIYYYQMSNDVMTVVVGGDTGCVHRLVTKSVS